MTWLIDLFTKPSVGQQVVAIALTAAVGLMVGKIKVKGISLGGAGALFVGILLGHLGLHVEGNGLIQPLKFSISDSAMPHLRPLR